MKSENPIYANGLHTAWQFITRSVMSTLRIIPVIDVLHGVVVRGIAGQRSEYRPIVSQLTSSTDSVEVARVLIDAVHPSELYLADLDAIQGGTPAIDVYRKIRAIGVEVWVDAGVDGPERARRIAETGCQVVAGLETVSGTAELREIVAAIGANRVVFSLDLRDGKPLREWHFSPLSASERGAGGERLAASLALNPGSQSLPRSGEGEPESIAACAVECGITRMIVLDLARVGVGKGTGTEELCQQIASTYPHVEVIAGGGVSTKTELVRLEQFGIRGVLVASALHDGKLLAAEW